MTDFDPRSGEELPVPAWVMYGFEKPDGTVQVWASRDVTRAVAPWPEDVEEWVQGSVPKIRLNVTMKRMTVAAGRVWREAFDALFARWSPDGPGRDRTRVGGRQQQLEK